MRLLWLLAGAAFLLRFAVASELIRNDPAVAAPKAVTDMKTYLDLADGILRGNFPDTFYYQPFYYTVFLPVCRLFGKVWPLAFAQSLLGAAAVFLAGVSARMIYGRRAGIWTSLLAALAAVPIYFTPYALLEILQSFWIALLFFLTLLLWRRTSGRRLWPAAGAALGCSILTRGSSWCFLPVLLAVALVRRRSWKHFYWSAALLILSMLLVQLPFALYNSVRLGRVSGPSTAGGAVLAIGNNPESAPAGLEIPYPKTYELWLAKENKISVPRRMWEWFKREPGAFVEQQVRKFMLFWDAADYSNNITKANARKSSLLRHLRFLPQGVLLFLGLAGLFSGFYRGFFRRRQRFLLLAWFVALYALSMAAFYILTRFRTPVMPLLAVSGGVYLARLLKCGPFGRTLRLGALGAAALFMVYAFPTLYASGWEPAVAAAVRPHGVRTEFEYSPWPWAGAPGGPYLMVCDHSSILRGGWAAIGNRFQVEKLLSPGVKLRGTRALLAIPAPGGDGGATLTANGERQRVAVSNGWIIAEIPVREEHGTLRLTLELSRPEGGWTGVVDARRDYGRTKMNGKAVPGEFAAFLVVPVEK